MNKRIAIASLLLFVLSTGSLSQADAGRYVAADGMFSFSIPAGWVLREVPGWKYKVAFGQPMGDFTPNINIVDESFSGTLNVYVDGNLKVMAPMYEKLGYQNFKVLSREIFTTTKQTGVRVITQSEVKGTALRQTFFFFNAKDGRKLVVTCTTLAAGGEDFDFLFEKSLKTFLSETPHLTLNSLERSGGSVSRIKPGAAQVA
jgi:hypothetical protein